MTPLSCILFAFQSLHGNKYINFKFVSLLKMLPQNSSTLQHLYEQWQEICCWSLKLLNHHMQFLDIFLPF